MKNLNLGRLIKPGLYSIALISGVAGAATAGQLFNDVDFKDYSANVENGETVFHASACGSCHGLVDDQLTLAGGLEFSNKLGAFFAPNITPSMEHGIGSWSNARFLNAVLNGTRADGSRYYGSIFPYAAYSKMTPEDALDMRAYMANLPESDAVNKEHKVSFPSKLILKQWSDERVPLSATGDGQIKRGEYLAEAMGHCSECHTPRLMGAMTYTLDPENSFSGETGMFGNFSPKITSKHLSAFGPEAFIIGTMLEAKKLNGKPLTVANKRRFAKETAKLSLEDRAAIYAYLTGVAVDVTQLKQAEAAAMNKTQSNAAQKVVLQEPEPEEDTTGATELMQRVEAFCSAPTTRDTAPAESAGGEISPAIQAEADGVIEAFCRDCHAAGRKNARSFLTGDIVQLGMDPKAVSPGNPDGSTLYSSIANGRMPIGSKMTSDEVAALANWITALGDQPTVSTPSVTVEEESEALPKFVGGTLEEMHLATVQDLRSVDKNDWQFTRYFSFANAPLPPIDCDAEGLMRNPVYYLHSALNKFINSVSMGNKPVPVEAVEGTNGAIVRIDLRDYNWTAEDWRALTTGAYTTAAAQSDFTETAWYNLAKIYPYSMSAASEPMLKVLANGTRSQVPIMRADWFTRFASEAPYYDMLLRLPAHISVLEKRMNVDVNKNIRDQRVIRAGFDKGQSGVSDHNRMLERHDLPFGGYYWKSYDFGKSEGLGALMAHPDGPADMGQTASGTVPFEHDGGEMIFTLPNGLQGYYLSTAAGDRLTVGPTSIVSNRSKAVGRGVEIVNARSCFECHNNGIVFNSDVVRPTIMASSKFSNHQRDILLRMYPEANKIQAAYQADLELFVRALDKMNITQKTPVGNSVSLQPPEATGQAELVTYLADQHFEMLDMPGLAREFGLSVADFKDRIFGLGDAHLSQVLSTWVRRAENGLGIPRDEVEIYWPALLPRLTDMDAYANSGQLIFAALDTSNDYDVAAEKAFSAVSEKRTQNYQPTTNATGGYDAELPISNPMHLSLTVPKVNVRVDDLLVFDIATNQDCELQLLYIEENKNVEEWPAAAVGPSILKAGEVRRIPYPGSGIKVRFDEPGTGETLLAFCRAGGLGQHRLSPQSAVDFAKENFQPLTRGITFEVESRVAQDRGQSAYNAITFNVK